MIVKEISANIECPKCNYGFGYSALAVHTKLEDVYNQHLKSHVTNCNRCNEGKVVIKSINCILKSKSSKHKYMVKWKCLKCNTEWTQTEYLSKIDLVGNKILDRFKSEIICPYVHCTSTDKRLVSMSKIR